ncbi:MAG TPA: hypothetical protein IAC14_16000 [Candidatus Scybalomonas excrementigallinarum]|nr:hypothetical protein [Candidatus Scybalomonas excrementigallinarum]
MNITVRIDFFYAASIREKIRKILHEMNELEEDYIFHIEEYEYYRGYIKVKKNSYGYNQLMNLLEQSKTDYDYYEKVHLSKKEKEKIEYFLFTPKDGKWQKNWQYARYFNTEYKSKCVKCDLKQKQITSLYVPTKLIKNKLDMCEMTTGIVVSKKVRELIEKEECTGVIFQEVLDYKTREAEEELSQLVITNTLTSMSEKTKKNISEVCDVCRESSCEVMGIPIYDRSSLKEAKDFNLTQESYVFYYNYHTWDSEEYREWIVEVPYYIISRKVLEILQKNNIKNYICEPVLTSDVIQENDSKYKINKMKGIMIEGIGEFIFTSPIDLGLKNKFQIEMFQKEYDVWFTLSQIEKYQEIEELFEMAKKFIEFFEKNKEEIENRILSYYQNEVRKLVEAKDIKEQYIDIKNKEDLVQVMELKEIEIRNDVDISPRLIFQCNWLDTLFMVLFDEECNIKIMGKYW